MNLKQLLADFVDNYDSVFDDPDFVGLKEVLIRASEIENILSPFWNQYEGRDEKGKPVNSNTPEMEDPGSSQLLQFWKIRQKYFKDGDYQSIKKSPATAFAKVNFLYDLIQSNEVVSSTPTQV